MIRIFNVFTRKVSAICAAFVLLSSSVFAMSSDEAKALLKKAEDSTAFYETDFTASYLSSEGVGRRRGSSSMAIVWKS